MLIARPAPGSVVRPTVRVLLIDEYDKVLLLRASAHVDGPQVWFAVGGAIEVGEQARDAAVREVREETGRAGIALGPEVWRRRHLLEVDGVRWDLRERWYLARVEYFVPDRRGFTEWEAARVRAMRWWSAPELMRTREPVAPPDLGGLLAGLLAEGPPDHPVSIGPIGGVVP